MRFLKISLLVSFNFSTIFCQHEIIQIENGLVQGVKMSDYLYGFRGIPYAKPPINDLRFEPPQNPDNWEGIWNATYERSECVQIYTNNTLIPRSLATGNEDCLYINVYMPELPTSNILLPIMVWIYGGAFAFGNGSYNIYAPDYLVEKDVIVVTFNYRVGIFGFLSTEDDAAPGNIGLRDQIFALKWIQNNIEAFGGDPRRVTIFGESAGSASVSYLIISPLTKGFLSTEDDAAPGNIGLRDQIFALKWIQNNIEAFGGDPRRVTIFGESAGSASVSYLIISPLTKGLFRNGIMQSGTALCLWALSRNSRQAAFLVGNGLGIITLNSKELVSRLKEVPAEDLQIVSILVMDMLLTVNPLNGLIYAPVIEASGENAVISNYSYELLSRGDFNQVPTIIGYNSAEGSGFSVLVNLLNTYVASYDLIPARLVPASMNIDRINPIQLSIIGQQIRDYYAGRFGLLTYPNDNFVSFLSGTEFIRPIQKTVEHMAKYTSVYFYKFLYTPNPNVTGAAHGDDLSYIFVSNRTTPSDIRIRNCLVGLWTNFAKYNNPTYSSDVCSGNVLWHPMNPNETEKLYLSIDRSTTMDENPNKEEFNFWKNLFAKYGIPPYSTY